MIRLLSVLLSLALAGAAGAQGEDISETRIGADRYIAGQTLRPAGEGTDDLFAAGERIETLAPVGGDAVIAGRWLTVAAPVAGDVYAAGFEITLAAPVTGDATLFAYRITTGEIGGDLRASGSEVEIGGPVAGHAAVAAEHVRIDAQIGGEVHLAARSVDFGDAAGIGGRLVLYEAEDGATEIPEGLAPDERIIRREMEEWEGFEELQPVDAGRVLAGFLAGVLGLTALATLVAALIPEALAAMRRRLLDAPFGTLWVGFLTQSVIVGAMVVVALTLIGLLAVPAFVLLAMIAAISGYVVGVYAFGVGLFGAVGRPEPATIGEKALRAGLGALVAGAIAAIPLLGWLFVLALSLAGLGAIAERLVRPRFLGRAG